MHRPACGHLAHDVNLTVGGRGNSRLIRCVERIGAEENGLVTCRMVLLPGRGFQHTEANVGAELLIRAVSVQTEVMWSELFRTVIRYFPQTRYTVRALSLSSGAASLCGSTATPCT